MSKIRLKDFEPGSLCFKSAEPLKGGCFMFFTNTLSGSDRGQRGVNRRLRHFVPGLADHRDQRKRRQRQELIQNPKDWSQGVQQLDLPKPETAPAQKTRVQPPRNHTNAVEFQHVLQMKARPLHQIGQLFTSVAPVMPEYFVKRTEKPWATRNQNNGPALIFEHIAKICESRQVVRQVLNNVQADYGVEFRVFGKGFALFSVRVAYLHVRTIQPDPLQMVQIQRVN